MKAGAPRASIDQAPYYASHLPHLIACLLRSGSGPVLEMGAGLYSTPALSDLCRVLGRQLVTIEPSQRWCRTLAPLVDTTSRHHVILNLEHRHAPIDQPWALAFLDEVPQRQRIADLQRLRSWADLILVHSAGELAVKDVVDTFKSVLWLEQPRPWISALVSDRVVVPEIPIYAAPRSNHHTPPTTPNPINHSKRSRAH